MKTVIQFFILILFILNIPVKGQNSKKTFDFWLGNWDAYWEDSLKGSNIISKELNDLVVEEKFTSNDNSFIGKSWTVYDSSNNIWKQTWVDNTGAYLVFTGGRDKENVVLNLAEERKANGKVYYMRMIFSNIEQDSFNWDWQSSKDKIAWKTVWAIKYKRKSR
ncbi:MAG: hypothetical protein M3R36_17945 [Bacteroidota bacterium]|nr:hypothetical protein [Bacteroidota bacterium]